MLVRLYVFHGDSDRFSSCSSLLFDVLVATSDKDTVCRDDMDRVVFLHCRKLYKQ
jgi:hypothetical protein